MSILDQDGNPVAPATPEKPKIRVCVAIPSGDHVAAGFMYDIASLTGATMASRRDIDLRLSHVQGTLVHTARRNLVKMAMKGDCTHILFLDSDMRFPRSTLLRLLSHNVPIVGANYVTRRDPPRPVSFLTDENDRDRVFTELDSTGLQEVDSTGFGIMLLDMDVFRNLPEPWFSFEWRTPQYMIGEDVYFCRKARAELGIPTLIDHDLSKEVKHVGMREYTMTDALVARDLDAEEEATKAGLGGAPEVN